MNNEIQKWKIQNEDIYSELDIDLTAIPYYQDTALNLSFLSNITNFKIISKAKFIDRLPQTLEFIKYNSQMQKNHSTLKYDSINLVWIKHYCKCLSDLHKSKSNFLSWNVIQPVKLYKKKTENQFDYYFLIQVEHTIHAAYLNTLLVCTSLWPQFIKYNKIFRAL